MKAIEGIRIGLTGGIGTGKTFIASILNREGIPVYNSDLEARRIMQEDPEARLRITALIGAESYANDALNRSYIATRIFSDKELLKQLNQIVHPLVRLDFQRWESDQGVGVVAQESALIFENNSESEYHRVILVTAPLSLRIKRAGLRDDAQEKEVLQRMAHQLPPSYGMARAHFHVRNILRHETDKQVTAMVKYLKALRL